MKGVGLLIGCSDIEIKNNSVGKTRFTPYRYQLSVSRGYCEIHQGISQILVKYSVTTGISQRMADGADVWGDEMPCPFWNLEPINS